MKSLALLIAISGLVAGNAPQPHRSSRYTYTATHTADATLYHYMGAGRQGDVNLVTVTTGCATVAVRMAYAEVGNATLCADTTNSRCTCLTPTTGTCQNVVTGTLVSSANLVAGTHMQFNSHGKSEYGFFMVVAVSGFTTTCTTAAVTVTADAGVRAIDRAYCVREIDSMHEKQSGGALSYFNQDAAMPFHTGKRYEISTRTASSASSETTVTAVPNVIYYNLGASPQVEVECLHVHITPTQSTIPAGCEGTQLLPVNTQPSTDSVTVSLVGLADCNAFSRQVPAPSDTCCGSNMTTCLAGVQLGNCIWVDEDELCFPTWSMHSTSLDAAVGADGTYVFASNQVHGPQSSYVNNDNSLSSWTMGNWNRRWYLTITNQLTATSSATTCDLTVSTSFQSTTTGGQCEPSSRLQCDNTMNDCMAGQIETTPRYWKQYEATSTDNFTTTVGGNDQYKTCNCLKQKEVCYRKGGCISTKRYQLVLQNCLDQGCGDYCNSGAGLVASLAMTIFAVLAVML